MAEQTPDNVAATVEVSNALFATPDQVQLDDGRSVTAFKIRMKNNAFVTSLIAKLVGELGIDGNGDVSINLSDKAQLLQLIAKFPDDINQMCAELSSLTRAEVDELDIADGLALVLKIVQVNRSFFVEKVAPLIGMRLGASAAKTEEAPAEVQAQTEESNVGRVKRTRKS